MIKQELEHLLFDNFYDSFTRSIDLSGLDFSRFNCGINIGHMKVSGYLYQDNQEANFINQSECKARVRIYQSKCESEVIEQNNQKAEIIIQNKQQAYNIIQSENEAKIISQGEHKATKILQGGHEADYISQNRHEARKIIQCDHTAEYIDQTDLNADTIIIDNVCSFDIEATEMYLKLTPKERIK